MLEVIFLNSLYGDVVVEKIDSSLNRVKGGGGNLSSLTNILRLLFIEDIMGHI